MSNPLRDEWLHGPEADPDPEVAEAVALITEYQLGLLSDVERVAVDRRLKTDQRFAELAAPMLFMARAWQIHRHMQETRQAERSVVAPHAGVASARVPHGSHGWTRIRRHVTMWRIAASVLGVAVMTYSANAAYGAILRARLAPASVTFTKAPLPVVMAELRRRYHIDVEVCDASVTQDRVTLTLTDAPVDIVADEIAQQTLRFVKWRSPYVLDFRPQPEPERGFWYNVRLVYRAMTNAGCHE